jgi:Rieske Fe-S protein
MALSASTRVLDPIHYNYSRLYNMERRTFLKWATQGLGAFFGVVLGVPAVAYLIDPLKRKVAKSEFKPVAKLEDLRRAGVDKPQQFVVRDLRRDAWTLHPNDVIGRVWLILRPNDQVEAFTTTCPHLGCSISNYNDQTKRFVCPCHGATFHLSGERLSLEELGEANVAPRGMDQLEVALQKGMILVKYQSFAPGHEDKQLIA